ncbi:hypothetical protein QF021_002859 [Acidovorax delafieldii]|nr:hypothetical protein [Acidovorax delafieldii]
MTSLRRYRYSECPLDLWEEGTFFSSDGKGAM